MNTDKFLIKIARLRTSNPTLFQELLPLVKEASEPLTEAKLKAEIKKMKGEFEPYIDKMPNLTLPRMEMSKTAFRRKRRRRKKIDKWAFHHVKEYLKEQNKLVKEYKQEWDDLKKGLLENLKKSQEEIRGKLEKEGAPNPEVEKAIKQEFQQAKQPLKAKYKAELDALKKGHNNKQKALKKDYKKRHPQFKKALRAKKVGKLRNRFLLGALILIFARFLMAL